MMTMPNAPYGFVKREGRNEFQLLIAFMCVLSGFSLIVLRETPPSFKDLSMFYQLIWAWFLLSGGTLILVSAVWREATGLSPYLEVSGLILIGGVCFAYGIAVMFTSAGGQAFSGPLILTVSVACFSRATRVVMKVWPRKISRDEQVKQEVRQQLVKEAVKKAEEITNSAATGEIPVIRRDDDDSAER